MNKPKQILLLEHLEYGGLGFPINISQWLCENFLEPNYTNQNKWEAVVKQSVIFIEEIVAKGFICSDTIGDEPMNFTPKYENVNEPQTWYSSALDTAEQHKNNFWITIDGINYLDKYRYNKLSYDLIKSNKKTNNYTRYILLTTLFFSALTLYVSWNSYNISKGSLILSTKNSSSDSSNNINLLRRLDTLQSSLNLLQAQLLTSKNQKAFPGGKSHK